MLTCIQQMYYSDKAQEMITVFDIELQHMHTVSDVHLHSADHYITHSKGFLYMFSFTYAPGSSNGFFCFDCEGRICPLALA